MIIVYKFASGSCDQTNFFGHSAVSFTGLTSSPNDNSFGISQMNSDSDPTWSGSQDLYGKYNGKINQNWQDNFIKHRKELAFPLVIEKAYIITVEDLQRLENKSWKDKLELRMLEANALVSEGNAYNLWKAEIQSCVDDRNKEKIMGQALNGADCAKTVLKVLQSTMVGDKTAFPNPRTISHPFVTPSSMVDYAWRINEEIVSQIGLESDDVNRIIESDKMWRYANGNYDIIAEETYTSSKTHNNNSYKEEETRSLLPKNEDSKNEQEAVLTGAKGKEEKDQLL
jgi:hypothetical protein